MRIRPATPGDIQPITDVILPLAEAYILPGCSEVGANRLRSTFSADSIRERFDAGFQFWVLENEDEKRVFAVAALRPPAHLFYLFVAEEVARQGWGRKLCQLVRDYAIQEHAATELTVNASEYATAMYTRIGFVPDDRPFEWQPHMAGIPINRLVWKCSTELAVDQTQPVRRN